MEVVVQQRVQVRHLAPNLGVADAYPALVDEGASDDDWDWEDSKKRYLWSDRYHNRPDHNDGGSDVEQVRRTLIEEAFQLVDVIIHNRHQAACGLLGVPLHLEILNMSVGRHPELVLGGLRQISP